MYENNIKYSLSQCSAAKQKWKCKYEINNENKHKIEKYDKNTEECSTVQYKALQYVTVRTISDSCNLQTKQYRQSSTQGMARYNNVPGLGVIFWGGGGTDQKGT